MIEKVSQACQETENENHAIILVKPCGMRKLVEGTRLITVIEESIVQAGLIIAQRKKLVLSEQQIRRIYKKLNYPDTLYGDAWKEDVINHLQSGPVTAYHLIGEKAELQAKIIRERIRKDFMGDVDSRSRLFENLLHASDKNNFNTEYEVLFGDD